MWVQKKSNLINGKLNALSTGVIDWGAFSLDAGANFTLEAWSAQILDHTDPLNPVFISVSWSQQTLSALNIATQNAWFVLIDNTGTPFQINTPPTPIQRRDNVFLGRWATLDNTNVLSVQAEPDIAVEEGINMRDITRKIGFIRDGANTSSNGANLSLDLSAGTLTFPWINYAVDKRSNNSVNITPTTLISFIKVTQTSASGGLVTVIDPASFDNAGTVTAIAGSNNQATNQRVFLFPSGAMIVLYGQTVYTNIDTAIQAINSEVVVVPTDLWAEAALIAVITVRKGATALNNTSDAIIWITSRFGETGFGSTGIPIWNQQDIYNNSSQPQIITDATRGANQIQSGTGTDTDKIQEWLNNAWNVTGSIDWNWLADFSDITKGGVNVSSDSEVATFTNKTINSAIIDMWSNKITSLWDGTNPQDAITKNQLDGAIQGVKWKSTILVTADSNVTLSWEQTIDGILTETSRVLLIWQTDDTQNGSYLTSAGSWFRTVDADTWTELQGAVYKVSAGSVYWWKEFRNTNLSITLWATSITFIELSWDIAHNSTLNLQGGTANEFFHLTSADYSALTDVNAQLTALHTDGSPVFRALHLLWPNNQLRIEDSDTGNSFLINVNGTSLTFQDSGTGTNAIVIEGGITSEAIRINNAGEIGFGTANPRALIDVSGDDNVAIFGDSSFSDKYIAIRDVSAGLLIGLDISLNGWAWAWLIQSGGSKALAFKVNETVFGWGTPEMYISQAGDIGFGTIDPAFRVSVSGNMVLGGTNPFLNFNNDASSASTPTFLQRFTSTGELQIYNEGTGINGIITFRTGAGSEAVRIDDFGDVGINEISPNYKLDVNGSFGFTPWTSVVPVDNGDVVIEFTNNTTLTFKAKWTDGIVRVVVLTLT